MGLEMTNLTTNLRLGMKCNDLIDFWGLLLEKGKGKFRSRDEAKFLQSSGWGKVGSSFDALD